MKYVIKSNSKHANLDYDNLDKGYIHSGDFRPLLETLGDVYFIIRNTNSYGFKVVSLTNKPHMATTYDSKTFAEDLIKECANKLKKAIAEVEEKKCIPDEDLRKIIRPTITSVDVDNHNKYWYGKPTYLKTKEDLVEETISPYNSISRKNTLEKLHRELKIVEKCKVVEFKAKIVFSKNAKTIRHAITRKVDERACNQVCSQCGVVIPTKEYFKIDSGTSGRTLNICPFCMVRIAQEANTIQEKFIKENPGMFEQYEAEFFTRNL